MPAAKPQKKKALAGRPIKGGQQPVKKGQSTGVVKLRAKKLPGDPADKAIAKKGRRVRSNKLRSAMGNPLDYNAQLQRGYYGKR